MLKWIRVGPEVILPLSLPNVCNVGESPNRPASTSGLVILGGCRRSYSRAAIESRVGRLVGGAVGPSRDGLLDTFHETCSSITKPGEPTTGGTMTSSTLFCSTGTTNACFFFLFIDLLTWYPMYPMNAIPNNPPTTLTPIIPAREKGALVGDAVGALGALQVKHSQAQGVGREWWVGKCVDRRGR